MKASAHTDLAAAVDLLDVAVHGTQEVLLGGEVLRAPLHHGSRDEERRRDHRHGDQAHPDADREQHRQHADEREGGRDDHVEVLAEQRVHGVHVVRDDGEDLAVRAGVVVAELHPVHLRVDVAPEVPHDVRGDPRQELVGAAAEGEGEHVERQHGRGKPADGGDLPERQVLAEGRDPDAGRVDRAVGELPDGPQAVLHAGVEDRGDVAEELRRQDREERPDEPRRDGDGERPPVGAEVGEEPLKRARVHLRPPFLRAGSPRSRGRACRT